LSEYYNKLENIDYFKFDEQDKKFIQALVYHEYLEMIEQDRFKRHSNLTIKEAILVDLYLFQKNQNYELCQLLNDILKRFDIDFEDFG
jgi:hypothetical protein